MTRETALADLVPLWRTVRERGVTALVTPALDYVGGLELGSLDVRFATEEQIAAIGEALRSFVASLDDEVTLHFLCRGDANVEDDVREYEGVAANAAGPALRAYVAGRAHWLREQSLRRTRIYLFFTGPGGMKQGIGRGLLGGRLLFTKPSITEAIHEKRLASLAQLRDRIVARLSATGLPARELDLQDVWRIHYELLNPAGSRQGLAPPRVSLRDTLWAEKTVRREGLHLAEYTEAEQLAHEDLEDARGHFRQGGLFRRVLTLKTLPEGGTRYFGTEPLLGLAVAGAPLRFTLAVTVDVRPQRTARWLLNNQHALVESLRGIVPFLERHTVEQEEADRAKREAIRGLFEELAAMSTKVVALSVSLLLEESSLDALESATEAARSAFAAAGQSELLAEEVTQVPAFLSMLPGAGRYQLRKKGCTSRNAADFLPVFAPWRGSARASSVLLTPTGDAFRFDLFDKSSGVNAHHGIVVADTGSGKSVTLGALTLDARAAGVEAILIDNGKSWAPLTELLGGVHIAVDLSTSISPFVSYAQLADANGGAVSNEEIEHVVQFLEVCVADRTRPPFDKVERDVVARAVRWCYEPRFKPCPQEPPLVGHFAEALATHPWSHPDDKAIADDVVRRLAIFCTGLYSELLNRPSKLRFDAPLLTFDLAKVTENAATRSVAMATIIQAITNRAMSRRTRTLVEVDEGHEYLGADDATERFLGGCYRKMRKYDTAMWMISQNLADFLGSKVGREAIVGNSTIRIFLRHLAGKHRSVIEHFGLSPRAAEAFVGLEMKPGWYSDFLLMYGARTSVVRLALHPLAYWILTTDKEDQDFLARAAARNPRFDRLALLQELASRYPHGVVGRDRWTRRPTAA
jgi:hypothetical protein